MAGYHRSMMPNHEGDQHLVSAAYHVLKALGASKDLSDDMRKLLSDLDLHLSTMTPNKEKSKECPEGFIEVQNRLKFAERKVLRWESNHTMIWDTGGPRELSDYLGAVDDIQAVMDSTRGFSISENRKVKELLYRANGVLQIAMSRLAQEVIHILLKHKLYFEPEVMCFHSYREEDVVVYDQSFASLESSSVEEASSPCGAAISGEYIVDLIHPRVIPDLKAIAKVMLASNYDQDFRKAFIGVRKAALEEYFVILEMYKFTIEDVLKMKWCTLNSQIRKWNRAMKIIIRVYLASEKQLCDRILGEFGSVSSFCFVEIARASLFCLLNFGEAVAMGSVKLEKLFRLLDMYEVLENLLLEIDNLLFEEAGSYVRIEFHELLRKLGHFVKETFLELKISVVSDTSTKPFPQGGIHPLTRYVMNYIKTLTVYNNTLNSLLDDNQDIDELENEQDASSTTVSRLACYLRTVTSALECNLLEKSKLYKEESLQHIFLMNNIHYMVQKIKSSDLRLLFRDEWIRKHNGKFQQHATSYERATWSSILSFLIIDGPCSNSVFKATHKEKCRKFTTAFEEVYKSQTQWSIPDPQLKEDLRISTSLKVIHAYRTFLGRFSTHIGDNHIKYSVDDLENLLLDFFEGSQRSLRNSRRR